MHINAGFGPGNNNSEVTNEMSRRMLLSFSSFALVIYALPLSVSAEWRCDCTKIAGSCNAKVTVEGNWVNVTSDQKACSRVDYYVDGQPFVTVVVEGEDRQDWLSRTADPTVLVQSCQVCQDNLLEGPGNQVSLPQRGVSEAEAADETRRSPVIRVEPSYPADARGLSGYVIMKFEVTPYGDVRNASVTDAQPAGLFEEAALAAVNRWKYNPGADLDGGSQTMEERFAFSPTQASRTADKPRQVGSQGYSVVWRSGLDTWNHCVKEGQQQDFVDMREVGLVNVCTDPVVVFSCVEGSGPAAGRWFCDAGQDSSVILVRAGDGRAGKEDRLHTADGSIAITYADEALIYPAAGSQYWWVACATEDLHCRDAARAWSDNMENSPAFVDPRRGFEITVAGSY